ncbi:alpha/beta fold hydrolase [Microbacterium sp. NPDC076911]|uniref:alpha/beta fold hydrolase n=1 Tax=Microbacterium sp. NPDC076911 TaxID=3154958 RepID=UPI00341BE19D
MSSHNYRTVDVDVEGGKLRVAVWEPLDSEELARAPLGGDSRVSDVVLIHGVTASHLAWPFVVDLLPGVRVIAPDLRGRGASNSLIGDAGMKAHANDLKATLDALHVEQALVVGHSMGGFVAVTFAHLHPERVSRLVLVDGGLPLDVPAGMDADEMVAAILGPTAARLSMRFASTGEYLDFWRQHPAFADSWTPELEAYLAYDLVAAGDGSLRPATSYETTADDTVDMNTGKALSEAIVQLAHPTRLLTVPLGLQNEPPGLYAPEHLARVLQELPAVDHERLTEFNHYTIVMSPSGAARVAAVVQQELSMQVDTAH